MERNNVMDLRSAAACAREIFEVPCFVILFRRENKHLLRLAWMLRRPCNKKGPRDHFDVACFPRALSEINTNKQKTKKKSRWTPLVSLYGTKTSNNALCAGAGPDNHFTRGPSYESCSPTTRLPSTISIDSLTGPAASWASCEHYHCLLSHSYWHY